MSDWKKEVKPERSGLLHIVLSAIYIAIVSILILFVGSFNN
jgi:hypothetical protein